MEWVLKATPYFKLKFTMTKTYNPSKTTQFINTVGINMDISSKLFLD